MQALKLSSPSKQPQPMQPPKDTTSVQAGIEAQLVANTAELDASVGQVEDKARVERETVMTLAGATIIERANEVRRAEKPKLLTRETREADVAPGTRAVYY